jgi:hypothetical protein
MNTKIFKLVKENLELAFNLPKYSKISIDENTIVQDLPWTPARYSKFKDSVELLQNAIQYFYFHYKPIFILLAATVFFSSITLA